MNDYQIEHPGITVTNLDRSIEWYKTNFGFEEIRRFSKSSFGIIGATIKLGNYFFEILQPYSILCEHPSSIKHNNGTLETLLHKIGANHIALNIDDIESSYNILKENNVEFVSELLDSKYFFCIDPDGILIEVRQRN